MKDVDKIKRVMNCFKKLKISVEEVEGFEDMVKIDGWIVLSARHVKKNLRTICTTVTPTHLVKVWDISVETRSQLDHDLPPQSDYEEIEGEFSLESACKKAWELIVSNAVEGALESIGYEEDREAMAAYVNEM